MRILTRLVQAAMVAALLAACAAPGCSNVSASCSSSEDGELTPIDGISIYDSSDFNEENGVVSGSGSSRDPYIIEGWEMLFNSTGTGITIVESDKYFVVRNVHIFGAKIGIRLDGVYHGRITDCVLKNCSLGLSASYSEVTTVDNNLIANCSIGISLRYCDAFKETDNTFVNNGVDLRVLALPWIETRQADMVFAAIAIVLGAFVVGLLYMRYKYSRPPEERP
jgi:parallel beta-helix repeat protein